MVTGVNGRARDLVLQSDALRYLRAAVGAGGRRAPEARPLTLDGDYVARGEGASLDLSAHADNPFVARFTGHIGVGAPTDGNTSTWSDFDALRAEWGGERRHGADATDGDAKSKDRAEHTDAASVSIDGRDDVEVPPPGGPARRTVATSLLDEDLGDDDVNCFHAAASLAADGAGDHLVFVADPADPDGNGAGHVLLLDGETNRVWDPSAPGRPPAHAEDWPYAGVEGWLAAHDGRYVERATLPAEVVLDVLDQPPGATREAYIDALEGRVELDVWVGLQRIRDGAFADPRVIGRVYHLEGYINGERVQYTGSTAQELRQRLGSQHRWNQLVSDARTVVTEYEVLADPRPEASNRGTVRSATNEALRSAEEPTRQRARQQSGARELNRIRAATPENVRIWAQRHGVTIGAGRIVDRAALRLNSVLAPVGIITGALAFSREQRLLEQGLIMAPYVFDDADGSFTVARQRGPLNGLWGNRFYKQYVAGDRAGETVDITAREYRFFQREGPLLYGSVDVWGNYRPGLLYREPPMVDLDDIDPCLLGLCA